MKCWLKQVFIRRSQYYCFTPQQWQKANGRQEGHVLSLSHTHTMSSKMSQSTSFLFVCFFKENTHIHNSIHNWPVKTCLASSVSILLVLCWSYDANVASKEMRKCHLCKNLQSHLLEPLMWFSTQCDVLCFTNMTKTSVQSTEHCVVQ